ncbi:MAG: Gfo/Idh/MocA family protein [Candidatus Zhuqueibacterota bacterium]
MAAQLGFGILGAGLVAPFHAKSIRSSEKCRLVAVADIDSARARRFSEEFSCSMAGSLDALLDNDSINVINVTTPNHLHKDAVIKIAEAKKSILVEKPPALSLRDVDEMIDICQRIGVKLGVMLQCRVRPAVQAVKQAIDAGRFGALLHADAYMKWFRTGEYYRSDAWRSLRQAGAGVTIQHAFHYIDLLHYLAGPIAAVQARMANLAHPDVDLEDTLHSFLDFANGARGVLQASTALWPGQDIRIEIFGTNGVAIILGETIHTWQFKDSLPEDEMIRKIGDKSIGTAATGPAAFDFNDHKIVIEDMVDAILEHREPVISAPSARHTLELALAMYKSSDSGSRISLPLASEAGIL